MGHGRGKSASSYSLPPPPVADYNVTGEIYPDATCNYFLTGTYNGKPYYRREDGAWFIWWDDVYEFWVISVLLGDVGESWWIRSDPSPIGEYVSGGEVGGTPTFSVGLH